MAPPIRKLLIANRGEIAIRITRAAAELGIATLSVCSEDDTASLHARGAGGCHVLRGVGARAYLDAAQLIDAARRHGCDAVHPGYGFLSESAAFARDCDDAGLCFVGPTAAQLLLFGDKLQARKLAEELGVPTPRGSARLTSVSEAAAFFASLGGAPAMLKAVMGGGGRGMRVVRHAGELPEAFARCQAEATAAFGEPALYLEELIERARHLEAQAIGDGRGAVAVLGERECSLQRRHQKLVELAPSPSLDGETRARIFEAAERMAAHASLRSLATFEFLYAKAQQRLLFIEANPRLQVEHTVTEQVLGVDLVQAQLQLAAGATLAELGLDAAHKPAPRGHAIELRIQLERIAADGQVCCADGALRVCELPSGPGVRVDGAAHVGYVPNPSFDPLLAKVIVHAPGPRYADAVTRARRALAEVRLEGAPSNVALLRALVEHPAFAANDVSTMFLEEHLPELLAAAGREPAASAASAAADAIAIAAEPPPGLVAVPSPLRGRVAGFEVAEGARVRAGGQLAVIEAMKMESAVLAPCAGVVQRLLLRVGDSVREGEPLAWLQPVAGADDDHGFAPDAGAGESHARADLQEVAARHARLLDAARPKAVERRRKTGQRTARENLDDLCDPGSFVEYGGLAIAAQRSTRSLQELLDVSPADGLVAGLATINAEVFGAERARAMVVAYDYTVFAGTQGLTNHKKQDRMFQLARDRRLPLVLYAEGGGGRPGDTDFQLRPMLDLHTFRTFAQLSGVVPLLGVVSGRCFAGNAVLLGCCDVIIATEDSSVGLAGPVMIEGAGLGRFAPEEVGPISVQSKNGVVDVRVADEAAATAVAKQYLSYFQGRVSEWAAPEATRLRALVPENRMRLYSMREVIATIADVGSVLELRREFGVAMITALVRIEGRPCGVIANDPAHLAGAIDAEAGDKASRFMRLCNAFGLPIISLCDTPGFMVGPEAEKTALVRRCTRMMVAAAAIDVPLLCVIVRKAYGLGAMAMAGGSLHAPALTVAWPTGELGAMGLEGAVLLALRKQLEVIVDPEEKKRTVRGVVELLREQGKSVNVATHVELDDVIDPADTRRCLLRALQACGETPPRAPGARAFIDTW